jgi:hypothetical protein
MSSTWTSPPWGWLNLFHGETSAWPSAVRIPNLAQSRRYLPRSDLTANGHGRQDHVVPAPNKDTFCLFSAAKAGYVLSRSLHFSERNGPCYFAPERHVALHPAIQKTVPPCRPVPKRQTTTAATLLANSKTSMKRFVEGYSVRGPGVSRSLPTSTW